MFRPLQVCSVLPSAGTACKHGRGRLRRHAPKKAKSREGAAVASDGSDSRPITHTHVNARYKGSYCHSREN
uniref:Uncharacterized protein n=1 Tax=Anguilla anguilla TaxID=7936 RepID=A0A0E9XBB9_ANGAN